MRSPHLVACALLVAATATEIAAQAALLRLDGNLVAVPAANAQLEVVLRRLLDGPSRAQAASGITTAIPAGTDLVGHHRRGPVVTVTLSRPFATLLERGHLDDAIEQITKTVLRSAPAADSVVLQVETSAGTVTPLAQLLESRTRPLARAGGGAAVGEGTGALAGRTIALSPGHGYYWHSTFGWTTQRGNIGGLTEDFHTNEIMMRYVMPALANMGARVFSCRERGEVLHEHIADNDQGAPSYTESGAWANSASNGYSGGTYRFASTGLTTTATAKWAMSLPRDGIYPIYVFYRGSGNRSRDARYRIHGSGGVTEVVVDQTQDDRRWTHVGDFSFTRAAGAVVVLENRSQNPGGVVIADAVRVGAGLGSIPRGAGTSGQPRWQECSRYWAQFAGAPSSVWDVPGCSDSCDDVTTRPKYAEWRGADAYVSLHTNAGGGAGTSSFIHNTSPTVGSPALQGAVHNQIITDIRALYEPAWVNRGTKSANFGEVRELQTMPGVLIELAFHDQPGSPDHEALHDPVFRFISGRAIARGVMRFFNPGADFPPEAPTALAVRQDGDRGLRVSWNPAPGATGYSIEQSPDGKGFIEVAQTSETTWSTGPLAHGSVSSIRVRAFNASGCSFPTEVLTAGTSHTTTAELLLVQGFDRRDKFVKHPDNSRDYLRLHADAIRRSREFSLGFDAASNEAVVQGRVPLADYRAIDWALGEESTADETFSRAEQALVSAYLIDHGGRLLVSGAEIGWDLDFNGSAADRAFYRSVLGAQFVRDDAGTYDFAALGNVFSGLGAGTFDNGQNGTYDVDYPDVIAPSSSQSTANLVYQVGGTAAIQRESGGVRVVNMGFPLECVVDPDLRSAMMTRALRFLLGPRALQCDPQALLGGTLGLTINLPAEPGAGYAILASLGLGTTPLPGGHILPLQFDGLLVASLNPSNGLFFNFSGTLNPQGQATGLFAVPNLPFLTGIDIFFSGLTVPSAEPVTVQSVLPWTRTRLQ